MVETNDEERQKKYEDKISLRSLLLRDIERINEALLSPDKSGMAELENLLSDLSEDIYKSVVPQMNDRTEKFNKQLEALEDAYDREVNRVTPIYGTNAEAKERIRSWYQSKKSQLTTNYVREIKKLIRWTMDEFGLGFKEEGKKIDEGGIK